MLNLQKLFRRKRIIADEVDEELRFHLDMRTDEYTNRGLSDEESKSMAKAMFGDVEKIRTECIRIGSRSTALVWFLNSVFLVNLFVGLVLRVVAPVLTVRRVGVVMMMIGGLGVLLVYAKQAGASVFKSDAQAFKLGLQQPSLPVSFDENGRSPFDRVREE